VKERLSRMIAPLQTMVEDDDPDANIAIAIFSTYCEILEVDDDTAKRLIAQKDI
jgi:hypothetical protein